MNTVTPPLILLTAGGTGGHVFPADALAEVLLARGYRVAFITDDRGQAYGGTLGTLETHRVPAAQMLSRNLFRKALGMFTLLRGAVKARRLMVGLNPAAVVGFGGYASVPAMAAALNLGIPALIHEQNAVMGRANRLFVAKVNRVATSFDSVRPMPPAARTVKTGMPVRPAFTTLAPYAPPEADGAVNILVLGGSQGTRAFSEIFPKAFAALPESLRSRLHLTQQCRPEDLEAARAAYAGLGLADVSLDSFFTDVPARLEQAHLLIARSGSSTVAEVTVAGRPALFVPYPFAADDHQAANAKAVEEDGGAWVMPQSDLTPESLAARLFAIFSDPETLAATAAAARAFAVPDAAERLADAVESLLPTPVSKGASDQ